MYRVKKRDGSTAAFNIKKVANAIRKAFDACDREYTDSVIDLIALRITSDFEPKIKQGLIDVEKIQDSAEKVLSESGYTDVSKAYILYRKQRENIRNITSTTMDYHSVVDNYINSIDVGNKGNTTYSVGGLILANSGSITTNYWLSEVYDDEIAGAHRDGTIHIHDLNMLTGCSAGWSLKELIQCGLGGVFGQTSSAPAKHLTTLCNQIVNFGGIMQNEWAGAQSFSSFDTYLAPFVKMDQLSKKEVKQCMQSLIYGLNTPSRWGTISPFVNICFDWTVPEDLAKRPAIVGGVEQDFTYGDCKEEMEMIGDAFLEVFAQGDAEGNLFAFPIVTFGVTKDFVWQNEHAKRLFETSLKTGMLYFANFVNGDLKQKNARLSYTGKHFNAKKLFKKTGGLFAYGENTGTIGTVSVNMPRIALLASDKEDFLRRLDKVLDISARSLITKRQVLASLMEAGLFPYTKHYLGNFDNHFASIGIVGMNEACIYAKWIRQSLTASEAQEFTEDVIMHIRGRLKEYQAEYHELFNIEAIAAGDISHRFARLDREKFSQLQENNIPDRYSGSSMLAKTNQNDLFAELDIQNKLQEMYTGGTIFDLRLTESGYDWKSIGILLQRIFDNYTIPYITVNAQERNYPIEGYLSQGNYS